MSGIQELGVFTLDVVLLPGERMPLHLFEPPYRRLFADCVLARQSFVLRYRGDDAPHAIGCAARFDELLERHADGRLSVVAMGIAPVEMIRQTERPWYDRPQWRTCADDPVDVAPARRATATERFALLAEYVTGGDAQIPDPQPPLAWSYVLAAHVELLTSTRQTLLATRDENVRLDLLARALEQRLRDERHARVAAERAAGNGKVSHE